MDTQTAAPDRLERIAPFNAEAEQQVLGILLLNNGAFSGIAGMIDQTCFHDPIHAEIFCRIKDRIDAGLLASPVSLKPEMDQLKGLDQLGGPQYLVRMMGASSSVAALRDYCAILTDLKAKRDILDAMREAVASIRDGRDPAAKIAAQLETGVGKVASVTNSKPIIRSYLSATTGAIMRINDAYSGAVEPGISTGLQALDRMIGFMRPGNMILIGGRPSMGKTTLAQNFAYAAMTSGVGVFYGSLEMPGEELSPRFLSKGLALAGHNIAYNRMIRGDLTEAEMRLVVEEAQRQQTLPLVLGERDVREVTRLRSAVRRAKQHMADTRCPLGLVIVDYIQQLTSLTARSTYDRASEASDMCKSLAMEFEVPVVALAQLSREVERREPPIPMLSDLRETGKLEEDADVVLFCYRDAYYMQRTLDGSSGKDVDKDAELRADLERCQNRIDLIVAKQRSGATGTVRAFVDMGTCNVTSDRPLREGEFI